MFKNILRWITNIIGDITKLLEKPANVAVQAVEAIKEYIANPIVDVFTMMTRTGIDNEVVAILRSMLPDVLLALLKAENIIKDAGNGDIGSLLRILGGYLQGIAKEARGKWWADLAAMILQAIANKPVDKTVAVVLTQGAYLKMVA